MEKDKYMIVGDKTGSIAEFNNVKSIVYPFDKYEITVQLSTTDEFIGITEVKLNKSFLSFKQRLNASTGESVDEFYKD